MPVDARIERGRDYRHALRQTIAHERFERIVIAAADSDRHGFGPEDVAWLLATAPGRSSSCARPRASGRRTRRPTVPHRNLS